MEEEYMERILKLQSILSCDQFGPGGSTSSGNGCACSTTSALLCISDEDYVAL